MDTSFARGVISAAVEGSTLTITIDNPAKRGALQPDSYRAIGDLVRSASNDASIRAVIITGDSTAFSSGMDVDAFAGAAADSPPEMGVADTLYDIEYMAGVLTRSPLPVIAAVEGACAGIGASVAFLADIIIAGENAFFTIPFTKIGLIPDGGAAVTLAASVGRHRAMAMALLHSRIPAAEAHEYGLVAEVAPDALARAREIADSLVGSPREALGRAKAAVNQASLAGLSQSLATEAQIQTRLRGTAEHREGVSAFRERRAPRFPG
ncbi:enoyl-CoA hydratase-related protein [Corynebacterium timonense]|uniref:2-(1,2-epoxy-1,2-dihydrophenyl)acetyl-CoA isomerase n=1 Tax=Corynebacterium timonense TaxID=441500 RepID=A0A1H1LMM2_9CORY|nr:enoyl-CoA hydratase-related protein [Corynebacterium timonense]SDR75647.1 2-(1,2-epoxy-1,2-dihydrophenyl)acetyl-CoA isomerase [Corynebacterium timonense]